MQENRNPLSNYLPHYALFRKNILRLSAGFPRRNSTPPPPPTMIIKSHVHRRKTQSLNIHTHNITKVYDLGGERDRINAYTGHIGNLLSSCVERVAAFAPGLRSRGRRRIST